MNQQQVQQLEIDDGNAIQVIDIDSNKPFAIVLPINAGNITFYDVNRNTVEYWNNHLWQFPACLTETHNPNIENQTVAGRNVRKVDGLFYVRPAAHVSFARHGRALAGESPEHAQVVGNV